jgi:hypothetical protein
MSRSTTAARAATFVEKWERNQLNETATAKEHFGDLCRLFDQPTPNEADPQDECGRLFWAAQPRAAFQW